MTSNVLLVASLVVGSYLLGSVSFSFLVVRLLRGQDVREMGSGNAGATNVLRVTGRGPALAVLLFDVGKGVAAVGAARLLNVSGPVIGATALAVVLGHIFPVFFDFRGGKGVATVAGAFGSLALRPALLAAFIFVLVVGTTRFVSLGSIAACALFPFLIYFCGRFGFTPSAPGWLLFTTALASFFIVAKHHPNITRFLAGREPRLGVGRNSE
jgi:glycerol-3-phosphate acyltransferase PlsY